MSKVRTGLWRAFRMPLLLAIASLIGLVSALIGDGLFDLVSWLTFGGLMVMIATNILR